MLDSNTPSDCDRTWGVREAALPELIPRKTPAENFEALVEQWLR